MMLSSIFVAVVLVTTVFGDLSCPPGYERYERDNMCIKRFDVAVPFQVARGICSKDRADVLMVKNEGQSKLIRHYLSEGSMWVGVWDDNEDGVFDYIDGTPLMSYRPWKQGEPNNWAGQESCTAMFVDGGTERWNDINCDRNFPFICSVKPCPDGWAAYQPDKTCVKKIGAPLSFNDARAICQDMDGDLITVKDCAKNRFVVNLLGQDNGWIGTSDENKDGTFTHVDGTPLGRFKRWNTGEPNNWQNQEGCVQIYGTKSSRSGYWNDISCENKYQFICSMPSFS